MAVSSALHRLLRVRAVEEEQRRLALESALSQSQALASALNAAWLRMRQGKALLAQERDAIEIADRAAALVEIDAARRRAAALRPRIAAAEATASRARQDYLAKRLERRQVETLIEEARAQEAIESLRRSQQSTDERFASRRHIEKAEQTREAKA
jgi:hypothetical protein